MIYIFIFILTIPNVVVSPSASRRLSLQPGASVTIPCPYDSKYIQHKKYWCYDAHAAYNYCTIQAYANDTQGNVTVTDNPAESLFTVTMKDLQTGNTGSYWCVVEIEGITPDVAEQLSITVKADPDLFVMNSSVSGEEGGSVTVQCLYSAAYQKTQKQWCRFTDRSCYSVWRTDTSQNSAVHISDDGRRSFSVQMSGLKKSDAGWYWCSAGHLEVPVHISVRDPPPVTATTHHVNTHKSVSKPTSAASQITDSNGEIIEQDKTLAYCSLVAFLLLLLILIIIIIICLLRKQCKAENQIRTDQGSNEKSSDSFVHTSSVLEMNEQNMLYTSVNIAPKNKTVSPDLVEDETIYSSVV